MTGNWWSASSHGRPRSRLDRNPQLTFVMTNGTAVLAEARGRQDTSDEVTRAVRSALIPGTSLKTPLVRPCSAPKLSSARCSMPAALRFGGRPSRTSRSCFLTDSARSVSSRPPGAMHGTPDTTSILVRDSSSGKRRSSTPGGVYRGDASRQLVRVRPYQFHPIGELQSARMIGQALALQRGHNL
jgi:hypothetical protein